MLYGDNHSPIIGLSTEVHKMFGFEAQPGVPAFTQTPPSGYRGNFSQAEHCLPHFVYCCYFIKLEFCLQIIIHGFQLIESFFTHDTVFVFDYLLT